MTRSEIVSLLVFFLMFAGISSLASIKNGTPDREAAVAAALKDELGEFIPEKEMMSEDPSLGFAFMCVESDIALDVEAMAAYLSDTIIRPVPVGDCTSKTVEGNFGMFTALTTYYDRNGEEAGHVTVIKADCNTTSDCVVDLDWRGWGDRFVMKRYGPIWKVVRQRNRWIV